MNVTIPSRFHLIWNDDLFYITVFVFGFRLHWCNKKFPQEGVFK